MNRSGVLLMAAMLVLAGWALPARAQNPPPETVGFHLLGPGGGQGLEHYLCPQELPPFLHWDLRQFPGCAIPFEINGNIPAPGNPTAAQVVLAVNLAATTWNQVAPTPVSLSDRSAASPCGPMPAQDSRNCVAWHPSWPFTSDIYAVTALWRNPSSGVILETDVMLNQHPDVTKHWQASPPDCASSDIGIQGVLLHEFGHVLGLGHPNWVTSTNPAICKNDDPANTTVMYSITTDPCEISLAQADKDGVNYLYTPDLADLPDPPYTTKVHTGTNSGVTLSGVDLKVPGQGPEHLFGIFPRYQYEWLAFKRGAIDDHAEECEARVVDSFDDGVSAACECECEDGTMDGPLWITMHVKTAKDVLGREHAYGAGSAMYLNGWFDWNNDGKFQEGNEHPIGTGAGVAVFKAGAYTFRVMAPPGSNCKVRSRFRLDWREDVGQVSKVDSSLALSTGAAQHGEVEDYVGIGSHGGGGGGGGTPGGGGIPIKHPPNHYCHPMGAMPITFSGVGTVSLLDLCHPPEPFDITTVTAVEFPKAGQDCMNSALCFKVDLNNDGIVDEDLCLNGPVCVNRGEPYVDAKDGLRTIDTEMVSLDMTGYSHFAGQLTIQLAPDTHSRGQIKQTLTAAEMGVDVSLEAPAASFFDVFWVVKSSLVGTSNVVGPTRVEANISSVPPGETISDGDEDPVPVPAEPTPP
jgi:hypothetical protein